MTELEEVAVSTEESSGEELVKKVSSIQVDQIQVTDTINPNAILLTGATGFLGSHLLEELINTTDAQINCLVRENQQSSDSRLANRLEYYFGQRDTGQIGERIMTINGDLSQERLGLSEEAYNDLADTVEVIIHTAALVKHFGDYKDFYRINVQGTAEIIELARRADARLSYISTMSVKYIL